VHVLVLRDRREPAAKCSLTTLRGLEGIEFAAYRPGRVVAGADRILLDPRGELLSPADAGRDLLLLDCSWRRLPTLRRVVCGVVHPRRLPALRTAYPRESRTGSDPACGLASVEALFAALAILGAPRPEILRGYRWGAAFLRANPELAPFLPVSPHGAGSR
jgi:ribosome biogenesis protein Tsr3